MYTTEWSVMYTELNCDWFGLPVLESACGKKRWEYFVQLSDNSEAFYNNKLILFTIKLSWTNETIIHNNMNVLIFNMRDPTVSWPLFSPTTLLSNSPCLCSKTCITLGTSAGRFLVLIWKLSSQYTRYTNILFFFFL